MKTISVLFNVIEKHTGLNKADLMGEWRPQEVVDAREIFVRIARDELKYSYPRIARELNRDHTSIMHLYRRKRVSEFDYTAVRDEYVENRAR